MKKNSNKSILLLKKKLAMLGLATELGAMSLTGCGKQVDLTEEQAKSTVVESELFEELRELEQDNNRLREELKQKEEELSEIEKQTSYEDYFEKLESRFDHRKKFITDTEECCLCIELDHDITDRSLLDLIDMINLYQYHTQRSLHMSDEDVFSNCSEEVKQRFYKTFLDLDNPNSSNVRSLEIGGFVDSDLLDSISQLPDLEQFSLFFLNSSTNVLSFIKNPEKIELLSVCGPEGVDISSLSGMAHLKYLTLFDCQLTDEDLKDTLGNCEELEYLSVSCNKIKNIETLSSKNLKFLCANSNLIESIESIDQYMPNLEYLSLEGNFVADISSISNLKKLSFLNLRWNDIKDISALEGFFHNLSEYGLKKYYTDLRDGNSIWFGPYEYQTKLFCNLQENPIEDFHVLTEIPTNLFELRIDPDKYADNPEFFDNLDVTLGDYEGYDLKSYLDVEEEELPSEEESKQLSIHK